MKTVFNLSKKERNLGERVSVVGNVLLVIFVTLFIVNYIRLSATNGGFFTFESLITQLSNVYAFPIPNLSNLTITADWGLFNFIKSFINLFTSLLNFAVFFSVSAVNAVMMIAQVLPMFLLG